MARAEGREGLEGLVCHGLGVEVVVEVVAVVGGGAADNGGDGGGESDENFSRLQGGWGNRERTSSSPLATSPSRVAAKVVEVAKTAEKFFHFQEGVGKREADGLVAVGELSVEGGGSSGDNEGSGDGNGGRNLEGKVRKDKTCNQKSTYILICYYLKFY